MDLKNLDVVSAASAATRMDLRHPVTGKPLTYGPQDENTMYLLVIGRDSEAYRDNLRLILDKHSRRQKARTSPLSAAEAEQEGRELLAGTVTGGKVFMGGDELDVTQAVALELMAQPWIFEQVSSFIEDRSNFLLG